MTNQNRIEDRDEILVVFHQECANPTAEQIIAWTERYPQFAEDIRAHASILKDWAAREHLPADEPDEAMLARGRSCALDALYNAEVALGSEASSVSHRSFEQIIAEKGTDIPALARKLDIGRSVLSDLTSGGMRPPVGKRLVDALTDALSMTREAFDGALQQALNSPRLGHAKADKTPNVIQRGCEEIIRDSSMLPERKSFWLGEDK